MMTEKFKAVDKAAAKAAPAMDDDRKWKVDDAMRDIMRAEGHKSDPGMMKDVKKRVKGMAKSLGC